MRRWVLGLVLAAPGCATTDGDSGPLDRAQRTLRSPPTRRGNLRLACEPSDAVVEVDGVTQGRCMEVAGPQAGLTLGDGMHRVVVKKDGFEPYQTYFEPSGAKAALTVTLRPLGKVEGVTP